MTDICGSCPHLDSRLVSAGVKRVNLLENYKENSSFDKVFACVECDRIGTLRELKSDVCCNGVVHPICVRFVYPFELYCIACKDYQFSSEFDIKVGRIRANSRVGEKDDRKAVTTKTRGLCNMGSTCFMSSILQILLHNPLITFSDHLAYSLKKCENLSQQAKEMQSVVTASGNRIGKPAGIPKFKSYCCIACEFKKLIEESTSADENAIVPSNLLYAVWNYADYMAGYSQQDAHEFLIAFLDGVDAHLVQNHSCSGVVVSDDSSNSATSSTVHATEKVVKTEHCANVVTTDSIVSASNSVGLSHLTEEVQDRSMEELSPCPEAVNPVSSESVNVVNVVNSSSGLHRLAQVFSGTIQSNVMCQRCGNRSLTFESFLDLSLSVDSVTASEIQPIRLPPSTGSDNPMVTSSSSQSQADSVQAAQKEEWVPEQQQRQKRGRYVDVTSSSDSRCSTPSEVSSTQSAATTHSSAITLSDCLQHYTSVETLGDQIKCEKCGDYQDCKKQLSISTAPEVLILHLKRFDMLNQRKITTKVEFALHDFDISPFVSSSSSKNGGVEGSSRSGTPPGDDYLYDLHGLVSHTGSLNLGHYVAYVLKHGYHDRSAERVSSRSNGQEQSQEAPQWLRCDDELITPVSEEEVLKTEGYLLFYVKQQKQQTKS